MNPEEKMGIVDAACARHHGERTGVLLNILSDVVESLRYVPEEAIPIIAESAGVSQSAVRLVCSRSARFSTDEVGRHLIVVCDGSVCHGRGSVEILQALEYALGIKPGETTPDGTFTVRTASCVGSCANAPVVIIDDEMKGHARNDDISKSVKMMSEGECPDESR